MKLLYTMIIASAFLVLAESMAQPQKPMTSPPMPNKIVNPVAAINAAPAPSATPIDQNPMSGISDSPVDSILNEDLIKALRDPFQPPMSLLAKKEAPKSELETYSLKDLKLNGVVTGPKKSRAMITTPSNKVFFVKIGDSIGVRDGKVTQITSDSIKILEYYTDQNGKKVPDIYQITLNGDVESLSKKEEE